MTETLNNDGRVVEDILTLQPNQELTLRFGIGRRGRQEERKIIVEGVEDALPGDPLGPSLTFTAKAEKPMHVGSKPQRFTLQVGEMQGMTLIDFSEPSGNQ